MSAGFLTLVLYIFEPNILAHGELTTPESATISFGLFASYCFWKWIRSPTWTLAAAAGIALGLAELSKFTWLILFPLWPVLWLLSRVPSFVSAGTKSRQFSISATFQSMGPKRRHGLHQASQLSLMFCISLYMINAVYGFSGTMTRLGDFAFRSKSLSGRSEASSTGNRFERSFLGSVPVPLPADYILGLDLQKKDLENYYLPSYCRGQVSRDSGWWYYYVYGLSVKMPSCTLIVTCGLIILKIYMLLVHRSLSFCEIVLIAPALLLLVTVSVHTSFSKHLRYVFPVIGILLVSVGQVATIFKRLSKISISAAVVSLVYTITVVLQNYPHQLAYFNEFAGGSRNGYKHLVGSSLDWGQDLFYLAEHAKNRDLIIVDIKYNDINPALSEIILRPMKDSAKVSARAIAVSPNCVMNNIVFPPERGYMLTPTLWIVEYP